MYRNLKINRFVFIEVIAQVIVAALEQARRADGRGGSWSVAQVNRVLARDHDLAADPRLGTNAMAIAPLNSLRPACRASWFRRARRQGRLNRTA